MRRCVCFIIFVVIFFSCALIIADTTTDPPSQDIDIVWSSSDGLKMQIYYTRLIDGAWLEPVQVTDDLYDNTYPVIDRDSSGRRWLFWTAYDNGAMEIHYATGQDDEWQTAEVLETDMKTNISPSAVIDGEDRVWVVWSANDGGLDDIMYAFFQDNSWSDPERVHAENELPDMLPVIELDPVGAPLVTWRGLVNGENTTFISRRVEGEWSDPEIDESVQEAAEEAEEELLELPPFVAKSSMVFIRVY